MKAVCKTTLVYLVAIYQMNMLIIYFVAYKPRLQPGPTPASSIFMLAGIMALPRVVLKDLSGVCEETRSELRSLPILCDGTCQSQVFVAATCLHSDRGIGRRHVGCDATEEGLVPARVAFMDYWKPQLNYLVYLALVKRTHTAFL